MNVVYWARMKLAKPQVIATLEAVQGSQLTVVESLHDLLAALPGADALVLADAPPDDARKVVEAVSRPDATVRWMHFLTAGREGFEIAGLPTHIPVSYPAGAVSPTVAEHAMALLLAMVRRLPVAIERQTARDWSREKVSAGATTLEGKRLAIVGYGQIGREIAKRARAFGMTTIGVSRRPPRDELLDEGHALADLHAVLGEADAVAVAIAQTPETHHLFDDAAFAACRKGAYLVNIARGGLIDQAALARALASGQLAGAGLDVTDPEPLPSDDPLWEAPNLLISPHFAGGGSAASLGRLADGAAANLRRLMAGEPLEHVVT